MIDREVDDMGLYVGRETEYIVKYTGEALKLLPDMMQELVRCKDCKFWYKDECSHLCKITGDLHPANWYCADGERKDDG